MHSQSSFSNQLIRVVLAMALVLPGPWSVSAHAGQEQIDESYRGMRASTDRILSHMLTAAMAQAMQLSASYKDPTLKTRIDELATEMRSAVQEARPYLQLKDILETPGAELTLMSQDLSSILARVKGADMVLTLNRREALASSAAAAQLTQDFLKNFEAYCNQGLAISPYAEVMPVVKPLMPNIEIYIGMSTDGNGVPNAPATVRAGEIKNAPLIGTGIYLTSWIVAAKLITGKWVLSQTAAASMSSTAYMATSLYALGVTAAVAVVVFAVTAYEAQQASVRAVHDQRDTFNRMATSADSERYFKQRCQTLRSTFIGFTERLAAIARGEPKALNALQAQDERNMAYLNKYVNVMRAYQEKEMNLVKGYKQPLSSDDEKKILKDLGESSEGKAVAEIGRELTGERLSDLIQYLMAKTYRESLAYDAAVEDQVKETRVDIAAVESALKQIRKLAYLQNIRRAQLMSQVLQNEFAHSAEIGGLYRELDRLIIRRARLAVDMSLQRPTTDSTPALDADFGAWRVRLITAQATYPGSPTLKQLAKDFDYVSR